MNAHSHIHFTVRKGIVTEVFGPDLDIACIQDLGLIVTDGKTFFSEEQVDTDSVIQWLAEGIPAFRVTNTHRQQRYRITKDVISDPARDCLLQRLYFEALQGSCDDYHLYVILNPRLQNRVGNNTAWISDHRGQPVLFAGQGDSVLAMACSTDWKDRSVGYVGVSDGWQDLHQHKRLEWSWTRAESGNVALTAEVNLAACDGRFVVAVGLGSNSAAAALRAAQSLADGFDTALDLYMKGWKLWQQNITPVEPDKSHFRDLYRTSLAILRVHESTGFPGGLIASLSVPFGTINGDSDMGGYHLVWPRDLVEAAGALLAAGAYDDVRRIASYLQVTQCADGHWPQNMWASGKPYWTGIQMDETALAILLIDLAQREGAIDSAGVLRFWPMVRKAAGFIVCKGPITDEDRWEEQSGYSISTIPTEIAALLAAADLADLNNEPALASYLRETADDWYENLDNWLYAENTGLARDVGVKGYYVRVAPAPEDPAAMPLAGRVKLGNRLSGGSLPAVSMVSPDALMLVRCGIRAPDDPRIIDTIRAIDALLKIEAPHGPAWHRYNLDGYGEHEDGSPFDGKGIGRAWPLLTGERAHYELAAGNIDEARRLMRSMESFANDGGMIPEQIWDSDDIPERALFFGHATGSANPLVWAHAEYVKLCRSIHDRQVFDKPPQTVERYLVKRQRAEFATWRFTCRPRELPVGKKLRMELFAAAKVRWGVDGWNDLQEIDTKETAIGVHVADLPTSQFPPGKTVNFTFYWTVSERWEGADFAISVQETKEGGTKTTISGGHSPPSHHLA